MASVDPLKPGFAVKDIQRLRNMVPIHTLPEEVFADLIQGLQIETVARNAVLLQEGDTEQLNYYLLEGKVSLLEGGQVVDSVAAGEESARFPIAHVLPRKNSVRADSRVRVACIDTRRISELLARNDQVAYEVDNFEEVDSDDWMSLLLRSPVLQQLPASNIQRLMMSISEVEVPQGEEIIRQGDPGDYFYMLVQGRALVTRVDADDKQPQEIAQLGPGNSFGEEALLSDKPRNSTITMLTAGQVLRLAKSDFLELVKSPLAKHIDFDEAVQKVEKGAVWIDLRSPGEYEKDHFPSSVNLPIESLRYQLSSLAPERHYVLYSNSGGRSAVAAYLMIDQGFDVSLLKGGLQRLREEQPEPRATQTGTAKPANVAASEASSELQQRVLEAERRAHELENQLKAAEASVQDVEQEKQEHLVELRGAVDSARERLRATEEEKQAALADAQKAYSEMEGLTSSLEQLTSERTELADRMREIEGLDKKLQSRLQKAERELIGERERAESAAESLEEIAQRLNEVMQDREIERDQHARERGELKEEVTCLRLELEQAQSDLEDLRAAGPVTRDPAANDSAAAAEKDIELASLRGEVAHLQTLLDTGEQAVAARDAQLQEMQAQVGGLQEQLAALQCMQAQEAAPAAPDETRVSGLEEQLAEMQADLAQTREAHAILQEEKAQLASRLEQRQAEVEELRAVMEAYVEQIRSARDIQLAQEEDERELHGLHAQIETLRSELRQARERLSSSPDPADVEAMRQDLHDVQQSLKERQAAVAQAEETRHQLEDSLEDNHAELDRLRIQLEQVSQEVSSAQQGEKASREAQARLEEELKQLQQHALELDLGDIRDEGADFGSRPLDVETLGRAAWVARLVPAVAGGAAVILLVEVLSFVAGRGEFFSSLFG